MFGPFCGYHWHLIVFLFNGFLFLFRKELRYRLISFCTIGKMIFCLYLKLMLLHIISQILERAPEECNNDLDSVIKKLNELCSGPAEEKSASVEELGVSADQGMLLYY